MHFYRKDIDGLRSVAVIPVILFHAGVSLFSGGFVGVDIFFVISGYLITTIILTEKEKGKFSLTNFYERRARRIAPALFLVLFSSFLGSWLWLSPENMEDFSQSLIAIPIFISNILFWQESGYWGIENELKPLLHTWSLAVEEQYYVLFPLFLMIMWRFGQKWVISAFVFLAILSFVFSQFLLNTDINASFFLLPARAWELAIGAGVAFYFVYFKQQSEQLKSNFLFNNVMSSVGLGLIMYATFVFDEHTRFPGLYALIPTLGTALIILFSSEKTIIGKILGSKIPVAIGLISYSAYLWHQPLFAFAKHLSLKEPTISVFLLLSLLSLVLAYLTWKYIEAPFRNKAKFSRIQIFTYTILGSVFFICIGVGGYLTKGYEFRLHDKVAEAVNLAKQKSTKQELCLTNEQANGIISPYCILNNTPKNIVFLYGDSHTRVLFAEAKNIFKNTPYGLMASSKPGCAPIYGIGRLDLNNDCYQHNLNVYNYLVNTPEIEYVVLSARWTLAVELSRFDNYEGGKEPGKKPLIFIDNETNKVKAHDSYYNEAFTKALKSSIERLLGAGKKVILTYPVPEAGWSVPEQIIKYSFNYPELAFNESVASTSHQIFKKRNEQTYKILNSIEEHKNFYRIKPESLFCNSIIRERCVTQSNEIILYSDDNHLSNSGAKLLLREMLILF